MNVYYNDDGSYSHTEANNWLHNLIFGTQNFIKNTEGEWSWVTKDEFWKWQSNDYPTAWEKPEIEEGLDYRPDYPTIHEKGDQTLAVSKATLKYENIESSELKNRFDKAYIDKNFPNADNFVRSKLRSPLADDTALVGIVALIVGYANPIPYVAFPDLKSIGEFVDNAVTLSRQRLSQKRFDYYTKYNIIEKPKR
jgi:hypothetical protein